MDDGRAVKRPTRPSDLVCRRSPRRGLPPNLSDMNTTPSLSTFAQGLSTETAFDVLAVAAG